MLGKILTLNAAVERVSELKRAGKRVAAYGAAAKGCTLLNYAGIKPDLLPYVCDAAPSKQGKYLPGSHLPILPPEALSERRPPARWLCVIFCLRPGAVCGSVGGGLMPGRPSFSPFGGSIF